MKSMKLNNVGTDDPGFGLQFSFSHPQMLFGVLLDERKSLTGSLLPALTIFSLVLSSTGHA